MNPPHMLLKEAETFTPQSTQWPARALCEWQLGDVEAGLYEGMARWHNCLQLA